MPARLAWQLTATGKTLGQLGNPAAAKLGGCHGKEDFH